MVYDRTKQPERKLADIEPLEHAPNHFMECWMSKPREEHHIPPFSTFNELEKAPEESNKPMVKKKTR